MLTDLKADAADRLYAHSRCRFVTSRSNVGAPKFVAMADLQYTVVLEPGDTIDEALANAREVIELCIRSRADHREDISRSDAALRASKAYPSRSQPPNTRKV